MVDLNIQKSQLSERVAKIYNWLDLQIRSYASLAGQCRACGQCCDFAKYDHKLFVTTPELDYLVDNIGPENIKQMTTGRCPYNINDRCTIHNYRFAGCRIFCCNGEVDFQSELSEAVLQKLKSICTEFQQRYHYTDLATALNNAAG